MVILCQATGRAIFMSRVGVLAKRCANFPRNRFIKRSINYKKERMKKLILQKKENVRFLSLQNINFSWRGAKWISTQRYFICVSSDPKLNADAIIQIRRYHQFPHVRLQPRILGIPESCIFLLNRAKLHFCQPIYWKVSKISKDLMRCMFLIKHLSIFSLSLFLFLPKWAFFIAIADNACYHNVCFIMSFNLVQTYMVFH